jgi:hypothetical protein
MMMLRIPFLSSPSSPTHTTALPSKFLFFKANELRDEANIGGDAFSTFEDESVGF